MEVFNAYVTLQSACVKEREVAIENFASVFCSFFHKRSRLWLRRMWKLKIETYGVMIKVMQYFYRILPLLCIRDEIFLTLLLMMVA
jgi:hypothetical protein